MAYLEFARLLRELMRMPSTPALVRLGQMSSHRCSEFTGIWQTQWTGFSRDAAIKSETMPFYRDIDLSSVDPAVYSAAIKASVVSAIELELPLPEIQWYLES